MDTDTQNASTITDSEKEGAGPLDLNWYYRQEGNPEGIISCKGGWAWEASVGENMGHIRLAEQGYKTVTDI